MLSFVRPSDFDSISEMVRISIVFMAASQQSNMWRNVRRSIGKQKTGELTQLLELKLCDNVAFVLDNKYT